MISAEHLRAAAVLEDLLRPHRRLHETAGFRSRHRLNLRRVMGLLPDHRPQGMISRRSVQFLDHEVVLPA